VADLPDILTFPLTGIVAAPPRPRKACSFENTNGVSTLDTGFGDADLEALRQKLNEMILNGRR
jgi:hypothetical protein